MIGAQMSKGGRKRKLFAMREPTGRPSRIPADTDIENCAPAQVKRLRDAAMRQMCEPEWGTELGRLFLNGRLSAGQYGAGKWFAVLSARCREAIHVPGMPQKTGFVPHAGGHAPDPDSYEGRRQVERDRAAVSEFMEAHAALLGAGVLAENAVRRTCEDNKTIESHSQLLHLQRGLEWLAEYRRLTAQAKNGRNSKSN